MIQVSGKAPAKNTTLVLLSALVIVTLSVVVMQVFAQSASVDVLPRIDVPQSAPVYADASAMRERWIERHMNPLFDAPADPQIAVDIAAANALRARWIERHMNPVFAQGAVSVSSSDEAMTAHWIERHMNPVFDR